MGYVFFDTETTGLDPAFDQIIQFAAIRTDHDLRELDRFQLRARLQPHVVPHPSALRVNGLSISRLTDRTALSNYEMMSDIRRRLVSWSPSIFVGYNSIGFDEHVLRHSLFQSLFPAYLTSQHQNGRADAFGLIQAACTLTPSCLIIPQGDNGKPSFKLDKFAPANGIAHLGAHDALADVSAVIDLCRLVKERSNEAWQRFVRFSNKAAVSDFVDNEEGFVLTEFFGGVPVHRPVASIGRMPTNPNGRFCLDLSIAMDVWQGMSEQQIKAEIARKGTPLRRVRVNGAPTLTSLYEANEEMLGGLDHQVIEARAAVVKSDIGFCRKLVDIYTASWTDLPASPHVERCLYSDGFPSDADQNHMIDFHGANGPQRMRIANWFKDRRLKIFAARLIHYEHRNLLDETSKAAADELLARRLMSEIDGPLTLPNALAETQKIMSDPVGDPSGILAEYHEYLVKRMGLISDFQIRRSDVLS